MWPLKHDVVPLRKRSPGFQLQDPSRRLDNDIGVQRDAVNSLVDKKLGELGIVAWGLATNPDLPTCTADDANYLRNHLLHGVVSLIEDVRNDL
jgi:hypothetical protein